MTASIDLGLRIRFTSLESDKNRSRHVMSFSYYIQVFCYLVH